MTYDIVSFTASPMLQTALANNIVIDKSQVEPYMWISVDPAVSHYASLYFVAEVVKSELVEVSLQGNFSLECPAWIKATTSALNMSQGHHTYKLNFLDSVTHDTINYYFSYTVTDESVKRPYIYVDRSQKDDTTETESDPSTNEEVDISGE